MRTLRWTWPMLLVALLVLVPWVIYVFRPDRTLHAVFVDKTVPFENRIEHRSLFWLIEHLKVLKPDGTAYDRDRDYLGAFPGPRPGDPPERTTELTRDAALAADLIYLVDTYGVYRDDLKSGAAMKAALERSPRIYGGLTLDEALAAQSAVGAGRTVVAEFNTFASPTGSAAAEVMQDLLDVRWTRWIGRYFTDLASDEDVPQWVRRNYEREWRREWDFEGAGFVLLQDDTHVEVLVQGLHTRPVGLVLDRERPIDPLLEDALDGTSYPYWFDIVVAGADARVLASFRWHLEPEGSRRLRERGLPEVFPAVVGRLAPGGGRTLYFAGDFADNPMRDQRFPFAGYLTVRRALEAAKIAPAETSFYWRFYVPLMTALLEEVTQTAG